MKDISHIPPVVICQMKWPGLETCVFDWCVFLLPSCYTIQNTYYMWYCIEPVRYSRSLPHRGWYHGLLLFLARRGGHERIATSIDHDINIPSQTATSDGLICLAAASDRCPHFTANQLSPRVSHHLARIIEWKKYMPAKYHIYNLHWSFQSRRLIEIPWESYWMWHYIYPSRQGQFGDLQSCIHWKSSGISCEMYRHFSFDFYMFYLLLMRYNTSEMYSQTS